MNPPQKLSFVEKAGYSGGDAAANFVFMSMVLFQLNFYTDVFGLSATRNMGIGQRPKQLGAYLDTIYPMVYPSHFGPGEYNLPDPNAQPGRTVGLALRDFDRQNARREPRSPSPARRLAGLRRRR